MRADDAVPPAVNRQGQVWERYHAGAPEYGVLVVVDRTDHRQEWQVLWLIGPWAGRLDHVGEALFGATYAWRRIA